MKLFNFIVTRKEFDALQKEVKELRNAFKLLNSKEDVQLELFEFMDVPERHRKEMMAFMSLLPSKTRLHIRDIRKKVEPMNLTTDQVDVRVRWAMDYGFIERCATGIYFIK